MKDFQAACSAAGIIMKRSTPHAKDGLNQIAEGVNARAQQHARVAMLHAAQHFDDIGFRVRDYWPQAYSFSALQNRARTLASRGELTFEQYRRAIPAPFGAYGSVVVVMLLCACCTGTVVVKRESIRASLSGRRTESLSRGSMGLPKTRGRSSSNEQPMMPRGANA